MGSIEKILKDWIEFINLLKEVTRILNRKIFKRFNSNLCPTKYKVVSCISVQLILQNTSLLDIYARSSPILYTADS